MELACCFGGFSFPFGASVTFRIQVSSWSFFLSGLSQREIEIVIDKFGFFLAKEGELTSMITSDFHHFVNYGFKNVRRCFEGISYRDRIHKAILTYFNILGVEMFLARVDLVIIDLSSKILVHFPGFLDLSEPLVTPSSVCIILCQGHLENADSFGSST